MNRNVSELDVDTIDRDWQQKCPSVTLKCDRSDTCWRLNILKLVLLRSAIIWNYSSWLVV